MVDKIAQTRNNFATRSNLKLAPVETALETAVETAAEAAAAAAAASAAAKRKCDMGRLRKEQRVGTSRKT